MLKEKLEALRRELRLAEIGFSGPYEPVYGMRYAVTLVARLSDAVVDGVTDRPTHAYFHHYRTVNAYLDRCALQVGFLLEENGYRYVPVAASQTVDRAERRGLFSHKRAAVCAGLGTVGKSGLFLSDRYGPRVRLATVLTDCAFPDASNKPVASRCGDCRVCVARCPAMAISGDAFDPAAPERPLIDAAACSDYMKQHFQQIGRGAVCGVCMRYCPAGLRQRKV